MSIEPRIFHFPQGLPGFETHHDFQFIPEEEAPLAHLISIKEDKVGFILLRPEAYFPEYLKEIDVDEESIKILNISMDNPVDVWVILTLHRQEMANTTVNLRAPILFNPTEGIGTQVILNDDRYLTRQPLFTEKNPKPLQEGAVG
jgi:flagellar assembly factor FliW